jgi:hypothetical protein
VEIDNWARKTIEFIPSYDSIHGADLTPQNRRGNAFDTATELIKSKPNDRFGGRWGFRRPSAPPWNQPLEVDSI